MPVNTFVFPLGALLALSIRPLLSTPTGVVARNERAQTEGPPSLEQLFRRHFDDVYRIVASLLGPGAGAADVEDLTQQVFLAAHSALPRFRGDSKTTTWLYGIASKVVLTHLRGRRRRDRLREALEAAAQLDRNAPGPDDEVHQRRELLRVWQILMRIAPKKRMVFILHEVEGLPGAEVARVLDIKIGTVWTRLYHARRELVAAMTKAEGS